jgi:hypothetical protein
MSNPFGDGADPFDVTVTATGAEERGDGWLLTAVLETGVGEDGGEVEVLVTASARAAYGLAACVDELERYLNATLDRGYRLDAALAMGGQGAFRVAATAGAGPYVLPPPVAGASDLAA